MHRQKGFTPTPMNIGVSSKERGFTLIELLVVIAIIGILSSVVLASLNSAREKSRDAKRVSDIKQLQLALELYYDSNSGSYPATLSELESQGFVPNEPTDPATGNGYEYAVDDNDSNLSYHLGAHLEDDGHSALDGDADCDSSSASGCFSAAASAGGFDGSAGGGVDSNNNGDLDSDPVYDVQP